MNKLIQIPSREFDALVATEVMGWRVHIELDDYKTYFLPDGTTCVSEEFIPKYSTDISAAWEVKSKMVEDGYVFLLHHNRPDAQPYAIRGISATFYLPGEYGRGWVQAKTDPLAICLAALEAKKGMTEVSDVGDYQDLS